MESTMSKTKTQVNSGSLMFKTAILSSTLLLTGVGLGSVFLPSLKASYPDISDVMLKSFVSLPNATQLLALVLVGLLTSKFGKKKLLMFGALLFVASGIVPLFISSFTIILIARLFLGFSVGLVQPIGTSLLADYYTDQERNKLMGFQSAFSGLANTLMTFIVGLFIQTSWRMGFSVYLIGLIIFFLTWIYLPKDQKVQAPADMPAKSKTKLSLNVIWWMLAMFLFNMAYSAGILEFSLTVVETHSGSATDAANVTAGVAIISLAAGLIFGKYMQLTKKYAGILAIALMGVGNFILGLGDGMGAFIAGDCMVALAFGLFMPYVMSAVNRNSTKENSAGLTGLALSAGSVANFVSTYFYAAFGKICNNTSSQFGFIFGGICCVLLVIEMSFMLKKKMLD